MNMQKLDFNMRQGRAKVKIESQDDLWYLSGIIDPGDFIKGKTLRKIQKGTEEKSQQVKKAVFLKIEAEKIEFGRNSGVLRIGGKIVEGPEDIPLGSWHGFSIEPGTIITIEKKKWLSFQISRLDEACKSKLPPVIICVFDREEAYFALMKKYGYELLGHIKGNVQKKAVDEKVKSNFYSEIISNLEEYSSRHEAGRIILASPAFWKDEISKELKGKEIKSKIVLATCSSADKSGIDEVLKRPETAEALREQRAASEIALVESVLAAIAKGGNVAYGLSESENAAAAGAVSELLITDIFLQKMRESGNYSRLEQAMSYVDSAKGKISIISSEHAGGKKLDGIGGIAALLRYKIR